MGTQNQNNNSSAAKKRKFGESQIPEDVELVWEPDVFKSFGRTTRINSKTLAIKIKEHFQLYFHDLKGCYIDCQNNNFFVNLYFQINPNEVPDNKIRNIEDVTSTRGINKSDLYHRNQIVNNRRDGKTYTLNDDTKYFLSKFMYGGKDKNLPKYNVYDDEGKIIKTVNESPNWKKNIQPYIEPTNPTMRNMYNIAGTETVTIIVTGLDIRRILREMYGSTMVTETIYEDGQYKNKMGIAYYEVRWARTLPDGTYALNIEQFDKDQVEKIILSENPFIEMNRAGGFRYF